MVGVLKVDGGGGAFTAVAGGDGCCCEGCAALAAPPPVPFGGAARGCSPGSVVCLVTAVVAVRKANDGWAGAAT